MGKSTINGPFSIAMLNYQRVDGSSMLQCIAINKNDHEPQDFGYGQTPPGPVFGGPHHHLTKRPLPFPVQLVISGYNAGILKNRCHMSHMCLASKHSELPSGYD